MVKLNLNLLFIHYYIKNPKSFCKKDCVIFWISFKTTKYIELFMLRLSNPLFILQFVFFFYSDLNLVNEALPVTFLFVYDNIQDKKAEI